MKNKNWILLSILAVVIIGTIIFFFTSRQHLSSSQKNYQANKASATTNSSNNSKAEEKVANNTMPKSTSPSDTAPKDEKNQANTKSTKKEDYKQPTQTQLATFSTKIYSTDSARQNNISITCNKLNNTIVKKGETFSFCNTVGPSSTSKGYQKADIFDNEGNKKKGLGGGNCQVSSTLYNTLLAVPSLAIIERHAHSNYVPYVPKEKDAAVAYGSYDLKFRNDSEHDIKITCSTDGKSVVVNLLSLT